MKTVLNLILCCLLVAAFQTNAQEFYSYTPEGKVTFDLHTEKVLVKFHKDVSVAQQEAILGRENLTKGFDQKLQLSAHKTLIVELLNNADAIDVNNLLVNLNAQKEVLFASPFIAYRDGVLQGIQDRVLVGLKNPSDLTLLEQQAQTLGLIIEREDSDLRNVYHLTVPKSAGSALDIANQLHETGLFDFAEVDFLRMLQPQNVNDPLLLRQWSLNNTGTAVQFSGTPDADMDVFEAWGITTGSSNIKIAVLDEGVDLNHPDLVNNLLPGFDATGNGSAGGEQNNDAHGTACAGIIAAEANNNIGVAGVAYSCKIIPVRIAYSAGGGWVTNDTWIANAINWAWQNGADILSNSWGGGSPSALINGAITNAVFSGRGGLGAPVLFAAGNSNGALIYPSTYARTIAVGAMSMCDTRKRSSSDALGTSCDGEGWWGSCFGTGLDIAAPGVKIATTDIAGANGYNGTDYTNTFNGTSSATPNAAGVMALILSANPSLTQTEARFILESTCDKVGGYTYNSGVAGQSNGTWSTNLGYGRVNAFKAVSKAIEGLYCDAEATLSYNEYIRGVGLNTLHHLSGANGGYADFTSFSTEIERGQSYLMELRPGFTGTPTPQYWRVYIDYNQDTDFDDSELIFDSGSASTSTVTGSVIIPESAKVGATRMRVVMKWVHASDPTLPEPCGSFGYGEVQDYTVEITNDYCQSDGNSVRFEWINSVYFNDLYNYSGRDAGFGDYVNLSTDVEPGGTYNFYVTPGFAGGPYNEAFAAWIDFNQDGDFNDAGEQVFSATGNSQVNGTISIPAGAPLGETRMRVSMKFGNTPPTNCENFTYGEVEEYTIRVINDFCESSSNTANSEWIDKVGLYTINNTSGSNGGYADFTYLSTELEPGGAYFLNLVPGFAGNKYNEFFRVWIDFNFDNQFDVSELVFESTSASPDPQLGVISIPAGVQEGETRMRVSMKWIGTGDATLPEPCGDFNYGEVEDYTVILTSDYCTPSAPYAKIEYIHCVALNTLNNVSGYDRGYGNYIYMSTDLEVGESYNLSVIPKFASAPKDEFYKVWIDFNKDNYFSSSEVVFENGIATSSPINTSISIPTNAPLGKTRMRIMMKDADEGVPFACQEDFNGEIEDYSVNIIQKYCEPENVISNLEFIKTVSFINMYNNSGNNGGYADFTDKTAVVYQGDSHKIGLTPGFTSNIYNENWKVWIDFNQDQDFDDAGELVVNTTSVGTASIFPTINIPSTAKPGLTRMRVAMKFGSNPLAQCSDNFYGEVEDYTLAIYRPAGGGLAIDNEYLQDRNDVKNPIAETMETTAAIAPAFEITTPVVSPEMIIFPNPTKGSTTVRMDLKETQNVTIEIFNVTGQKVQTQLLEATQQVNELMDLSNLVDGTYLISLTTEDGTKETKRVILNK